MRILSLAFLLALSACAAVTKQSVTPFAFHDVSEICIIQNTSGTKNFLQTYKAAVKKRGYEVRVLYEGADIDECIVTSTYTASWRVGELFVHYMYKTKINLYRDGEKVAGASYKVLEDGDYGKHIEADQKINELVGLMFPNKGSQSQ